MTKHSKRLCVFAGGLATILLAIGVFFACCGVYRVSGESMLPTLTDQQLIVVDKTNHDPSLGDIVVYHSPESDSLVVKRVVAISGDSLAINISQDGQYQLCNGKQVICDISIDQYYFLYALLADQATVPDKYIFCVGDNADFSKDSRSYGFVSVENIIGVLL